ncbi:WD40 repeat domain-containing protein [Deinococcus multiflagellatus]|uniref:WD40 repeat domain-containing protein n=1 Tax=Deinococcus multiflagellatus TaxID=1656887 RepID=A0ABW1ZPI6_9DEIO|nr:hypothetical protein [Deinococcus multiflagellatus]MBZ9713958.1 hypothetical protein [Deinococcus multiflagellatus]
MFASLPRRATLLALLALGPALALSPAPLRWRAPAALLGFDGQGRVVTAPLTPDRGPDFARLDVRDPGSGAVTQTLSLPTAKAGPPLAPAWTPDLGTVAWLSRPVPGQPPALHLRRGDTLRTLGGPGQGLEGAQVLALSPDGAALYVGNFNGYVQVWDTASGERTRTLLQKSWGVERLLPSPDGTRLFVGTRGHFTVYDARTWVAQPLPEAFAKTPHSLAFTPDSRALYVADGHDPVRRYDLTQPGRVTTLPRPTGSCDVPFWQGRCAAGPVTLSLSADGRTLLVGHFNGLAVVYDAATGQERGRQAGTTPFFTTMTPDGRTLLSGGVMDIPLQARALPQAP